MKIVIDANILVSAIIRDSYTRKILLRLQADFYTPRKCIEELLRHKGLIVKKASITDFAFNLIMRELLEKIKILSDEQTVLYKDEAYRLMEKIDINDAPFISAAMAVKADYIWSNDKHFKQQNKVKALTTEELVKLLSRWEL